MPVDPRKRQRKLERRKKKETAEKKARAQRNLVSPATQLARTAGTPVLDCLLGDNIWDVGIGYLLISRGMPDGRAAYAIFLMDVSCLGVKNVMYGVMPRRQYQENVLPTAIKSGARTKIAPAHARKLIEDAVEYAHGLGLSPHRDYEIGARIFADIDSSSCTENFKFGKDGKPLFVAGPNDSMEKCRRIMATLLEHCGDGNYHFVVPVRPDELDSDEIEMIEDESMAE